MRWHELDFDAGLWKLPGSRTKNGKPHVVHISEPVRAILQSLPKVKDNPFVFPGESEAGNIGFFSGTENLVIDALTANGDNIPDWQFHDFRRAGVTALAYIGFASHVCDRLLNHITGTITALRWSTSGPPSFTIAKPHGRMGREQHRAGVGCSRCPR